jgi:hypothetical protein
MEVTSGLSTADCDPSKEDMNEHSRLEFALLMPGTLEDS